MPSTIKNRIGAASENAFVLSVLCQIVDEIGEDSALFAEEQLYAMDSRPHGHVNLVWEDFVIATRSDGPDSETCLMLAITTERGITTSYYDTTPKGVKRLITALDPHVQTII